MMDSTASVDRSASREDLKVPLNPEASGTMYPSGYHHPEETELSFDSPRNCARSIRSLNPPAILRYMRYINVVLALFQGLTGFLGLFDIAKFNVTSFLIAAYVIIFAMLLLAFECRFKSMEPVIRKNFGFLFTYRGRAIFIFFVGFLDFGMADAIAWVAGVLMCLNAVLNFFVIVAHPGFRSGQLTADMDPTIGYSSGEQEASAFIQRNPEMAAKAGSYALDHARRNPAYAAKMAQSALSSQQTPGPYVPPTSS